MTYVPKNGPAPSDAQLGGMGGYTSQCDDQECTLPHSIFICTSVTDKTRANAALIVRAVNAHEALVAAAQRALALLENIGTGTWANTPAGDDLRAALALAEQEVSE